LFIRPPPYPLKPPSPNTKNPGQTTGAEEEKKRRGRRGLFDFLEEDHAPEENGLSTRHFCSGFKMALTNPSHELFEIELETTECHILGTFVGRFKFQA
jgi:hypothetical protein